MKKKIKIFILPAAVVILLLILLLIFGIMRLSATKKGLDGSKYFDRGFVENAVVETVNLISQEDYGTLSAISAESLKEEIDAGQLKSRRSKIAQDWGNCTEYGVIHTYEIIKKDGHYAQGTVEVTYEYVTVNFCFLYNVDMELVEITME